MHVRAGSLELLCRLGAAQLWKRNVHHCYIRTQFSSPLHGGRTVGSFSHHFHVLFGVDERLETRSDHHVIIC